MLGWTILSELPKKFTFPNVVTAVLASYRGYDTFGEAVVIFSAGLGVLLLLGLNGNAGRWTARPTGRQIYPPIAPSANSRLIASRDNIKLSKGSIIEKPSSVNLRKSKNNRLKDKGNN